MLLGPVRNREGDVEFGGSMKGREGYVSFVSFTWFLVGGGSGGGGDAFEQFLHHGLFSLRRIRTLGKREIQ